MFRQLRLLGLDQAPGARPCGPGPEPTAKTVSPTVAKPSSLAPCVGTSTSCHAVDVLGAVGRGVVVLGVPAGEPDKPVQLASALRTAPIAAARHSRLVGAPIPAVSGRGADAISRSMSQDRRQPGAQSGSAAGRSSA